MSEQAPERPAPARGGGFSLTKRYGPLPAWAWGLLGGIGVYAVYRFVQARKTPAAAAAPATAGTSDGTTQQTDFAPQIATLQAEIEQLQQGTTQQASAGAEQEQDISALETTTAEQEQDIKELTPRPKPKPAPKPKPKPRSRARPKPRPGPVREIPGGPMRRPG